MQIDVADGASGSPDTNVMVTPNTAAGAERFRVNINETLGAPQTGEKARVTFTVTVAIAEASGGTDSDTTTQPDEPGRVVIQAQDGMNLRADASTNTNVLARVPYETTLDIISVKPGIVPVTRTSGCRCGTTGVPAGYGRTTCGCAGTSLSTGWARRIVIPRRCGMAGGCAGLTSTRITRSLSHS